MTQEIFEILKKIGHKSIPITRKTPEIMTMFHSKKHKSGL